MDDPQFGEARQLLGRIQAAQMSLIAAGTTSGEFRDLDLDFANRAIGWMINGLVLDSSRPTVTVPHQWATHVADMIVLMLLADPGRLPAIRLESLAGTTSRTAVPIMSDD